MSWQKRGGCGDRLRSSAHESNREKPPLRVNRDIAARVDAIDWTQVTADLDAQGCAVLKGLLVAGRMPTRSPRSIPTTRISAAGS